METNNLNLDPRSSEFLFSVFRKILSSSRMSLTGTDINYSKVELLWRLVRNKLRLGLILETEIKKEGVLALACGLVLYYGFETLHSEIYKYENDDKEKSDAERVQDLFKTLVGFKVNSQFHAAIMFVMLVQSRHSAEYVSGYIRNIGGYAPITDKGK